MEVPPSPTNLKRRESISHREQRGAGASPNPRPTPFLSIFDEFLAIERRAIRYKLAPDAREFDNLLRKREESDCQLEELGSLGTVRRRVVQRLARNHPEMALKSTLELREGRFFINDLVTQRPTAEVQPMPMAGPTSTRSIGTQTFYPQIPFRKRGRPRKNPFPLPEPFKRLGSPGSPEPWAESNAGVPSKIVYIGRPTDSMPQPGNKRLK